MVFLEAEALRELGLPFKGSFHCRDKIFLSLEGRFQHGRRGCYGGSNSILRTYHVLRFSPQSTWGHGCTL